MFNFLIYSHLPRQELNLDFSGASDLQRTAGLGTSRNACQNCWIGHQQKHAQQNCWTRHQWKHAWQNCWIGHQQKLFSLIYWKQHTSSLLFSGELLETGGIYNLTTAKNSWIGHQQKRLPKLLDWAPAETRPAKLLDWAPAETRLAKLLDWAPAETIQFELLENSRPPAFARFWQLSYLQKGPFDLGIENFALRNETSPSSFSTSEQVHSRGTEHIFPLWMVFTQGQTVF